MWDTLLPTLLVPWLPWSEIGLLRRIGRLIALCGVLSFQSPLIFFLRIAKQQQDQDSRK